MNQWTAKKAAILGVVFSGASVAFLFATAAAMPWQRGSGAQKDWRMVLGVGFGVLFACSGLAAILAFLVSVSLIAYKRCFGLRQVSPATLTAGLEPPSRSIRNPAIVTLTGFAVLLLSTKFGPVAIFLVGIPGALIASAVAGGARSPKKIPIKDAILYVGISVAIVIGVVAYAIYQH